VRYPSHNLRPKNGGSMRRRRAGSSRLAVGTGYSRPQRFLSPARLLFLTAFFGTLLAASVRLLLADFGDIHSASMEPTLLPGDRVVLNRVAYGLRLPYAERPFWEWSQPERGDIVVFRRPSGGRPTIKRIIGMPGDRIRMYRNKLYVNGRPARYGEGRGVRRGYFEFTGEGAPFIENEVIEGVMHRVVLTPGVRASNSFPTVVVPADMYFVMGDNRDLSVDSRAFGFVAKNDVLGRVNHVILSLDPDTGYAPRWERFLYPLS
jgi:signal peptidase I